MINVVHNVQKVAAYQMLCFGVCRHLLKQHRRSHSSCFDGVLNDVSARQVTHEIHKVGCLLHYAAPTSLCVPPLGLLYVVVGAGVPAHNGCWGYFDLQPTGASHGENQLCGLQASLCTTYFSVCPTTGSSLCYCRGTGSNSQWMLELLRSAINRCKLWVEPAKRVACSAVQLRLFCMSTLSALPKSLYTYNCICCCQYATICISI